jgi:hypothetical protein
MALKQIKITWFEVSNLKIYVFDITFSKMNGNERRKMNGKISQFNLPALKCGVILLKVISKT